MKTNKFILGLVLLIISLAFSSCGRDDDFILPKETTSGKNTLGFKVDGEVFLRRKNTLFEPYNLVARYAKSFDIYYFQIIARSENQNGDLGHLSFSLDAPIQLEKKLKFRRAQFSISPQLPKYEDSIYIVLPNYEVEDGGEIIFTYFDTIARIASGRFNFYPQRTVEGELQSISITEGRFDVKLVDY